MFWWAKNWIAPFILSSLNGTNGFALSSIPTWDYGGGSSLSVGAVGDVNGDGIDDFFIGVPFVNNLEGVVYVVFGHANPWATPFTLSSLNGSNGFTLTGIAQSWAGFSVSVAGDVNKDGIVDFIIGAPACAATPSRAGTSYVVFGHTGPWTTPFTLSSLNGSNGFELTGTAEHDCSGYSVNTAGDVNGDGIADLIISAPYKNNGTSYVVFGHTDPWATPFSLSSLNGSNGCELTISIKGTVGRSAGTAGDVNGDGIADLIIGSDYANNEAGASYVVFGHTDPWVTPFSLSSLNGSNGFELRGVTAGDWSGFSVGAAGDVDGDGAADLIIGAFGANNQAGASYVVFGVPVSPSPSPTPSCAASFSSAIVELDCLNGQNGFELTGMVVNSMGQSVGTAGDVNGDGIADFIIGAPGVYNGAPYNGSSYVIFGHTNLWKTPFDLSTLNGINGFTLIGVEGLGNTGDAAGYSVGAAGDVNGDGIDDLIIGAPNVRNSLGGNAGATYIVFGHAESWTSVVHLSTLNGVNGFIVMGVASGDRSGFSVATAGDVNGDGIDDLIIGAHSANSFAGATYVVFGHTGVWDTPLSLASLNGRNGFVLMGVNAGDGSGLSVGTAGDVNGDGIADVIVGAYQANNDLGAAYVVFGHVGVWSTPFSLASLDGTNGCELRGFLQGTELGQWAVGSSVCTAGDVNGDGIADVIIGAPNTNTAYIVFGHVGVWSTPFSLATLNGANGFELMGAGGSVGTAGDVNGDGVADVAIGVNAGGTTYIVFGHTGSWVSPFNLASINGSNGFQLIGVESVCVRAAGDVNQDGLADIIIGSPTVNAQAGVSYVVFGFSSSRTPTASSSMTVTPSVSQMSSSSISGTGAITATQSLSGSATPSVTVAISSSTTLTPSVAVSTTANVSRTESATSSNTTPSETSFFMTQTPSISAASLSESSTHSATIIATPSLQSTASVLPIPEKCPNHTEKLWMGIGISGAVVAVSSAIYAWQLRRKLRHLLSTKKDRLFEMSGLVNPTQGASLDWAEQGVTFRTQLSNYTIDTDRLAAASGHRNLAEHAIEKLHTVETVSACTAKAVPNTENLQAAKLETLERLTQEQDKKMVAFENADLQKQQEIEHLTKIIQEKDKKVRYFNLILKQLLQEQALLFSGTQKRLTFELQEKNKAIDTLHVQITQLEEEHALCCQHLDVLKAQGFSEKSQAESALSLSKTLPERLEPISSNVPALAKIPFLPAYQLKNTGDKKSVSISQAHESAINGLACLSQDSLLVSASSDKTLKIWAVEPSIRCVRVLSGHSRVICAQALGNKQFVSGAQDGTLNIWHLEQDHCLKTIQAHDRSIHAMVILPNGHLASAAADATIKIWDFKSGSCLKTLKGHTHAVRCLQVLKSGELVSGSLDGTIKLWNLSNARCLRTLKGHRGPVYSLQVLSEQMLASGGEDKVLRIWDLQSGEVFKRLKGHQDPIHCLALLANGALVSGSKDQSLKVWDVEQEQALETLGGYVGSVQCLIALSDGRLVSGSADKMLRMWNMEAFNLTPRNKPAT